MEVVLERISLCNYGVFPHALHFILDGDRFNVCYLVEHMRHLTSLKLLGGLPDISNCLDLIIYVYVM